MKIGQDTFKDGKLNYGSVDGQQRLEFWLCRWDSFIILFEEKYPEMILKLSDITLFKSYIITSNITKLSFKYKDKLIHSLSYNNMEHVNYSEFNKILKKFKNYLYHSPECNLIKCIIKY